MPENEVSTEFNFQNLPTLINDNIVGSFINSQMIKPADIKQLADAKEFIIQNYMTVPMYRSLPIKLFGVLNDKDHPTLESKIWQCQVEAEVHGNELIRDLHELELKGLKVEKMMFTLEKMTEKIQNDQTLSANQVTEIKFDITEQRIHLSLAKFEYMQLQKRIKYRISEVHEWKVIFDKIKSLNINPLDFNKMIAQSFEKKWIGIIADTTTPEDDRKVYTAQLELLRKNYKLESNN